MKITAKQQETGTDLRDAANKISSLANKNTAAEVETEGKSASSFVT